MGRADDRRNSPVDFHLYQVDRDLDDGDKKFQELREHFDEEISGLKTQVRNLTRAAVGVLLALLTTSITLILNVIKP